MFIAVNGVDRMGKAFSEEERSSVQENLRRTGLKLFSEKGLKGVSIRELTSAAGIAQGGFYTFYKDKTDFVIDLMELRIKEKLAAAAEKKERSLSDPVGYLTELYYEQGMHLIKNKAFVNTSGGTLEMYLGFDTDTVERIRRHYRDFINMLIDYWRDNGYTVDADIGGIMELMRMAGVLISESAIFDSEYFGRSYKVFCTAGVNEYLKVSR